uniref:Metalloendopeptidase n=1 Tax=Plectus sambesii TaxID=2011161 RepID=A0A914X9X8_9BILA
MREAFSEFKQKTCIEFREEDWVPWYHWKRWESESPYVIIRKSKRVNLLAESKLDEKLNRTLMYMSENSLNQPSDSLSRGIALHELGHILGLTHEHQRPDAIKYITVAASSELSHDTAIISHEHASEDELVWPFDPMSVTIYTPTENAKYHFSLTPLCSDVKQSEIGKGKIEGRLTYWDAVKINSLYCPDQVAFDANRRAPPCQGSKKAKFLDVPRSVRRGNSMSRGRTKN